MNFFAGGWFSAEKTEYRQSLEKMRWGGVMNRFYVQIISAKDGVDEPGKIWSSRFLVDHTGDAFANTSAASGDYAVQSAVGLPPVDLAPGAAKTLDYEIYAGPKEYSRLVSLGRQRQQVMFYGFFTPISIVLSKIMRWMHNITGNWGLAIILLTICVRSFLWYPQSRAQYSMKRMGLLSPKMKELQEKYKDDKQTLNREVMALYKENKVNPAAGCVPLLVQLPVFILLFRVLTSYDFTGVSFLGISLDGTVLSTLGKVLGLQGPTADIGVMAVLNGILANPAGLAQVSVYLPNLLLLIGIGVVTWYQQQLSASGNPQMAMMNWFMPLFLTFICVSLPGGVLLYWGVSSVMGVVHQIRVTRQTAREMQEKPVLFKDKPV